MRLASSKGRAYDAYGDVAQNDGRQGHSHRHSTSLQEVVRIARSVWGARVQMELDDYLPYSTYRAARYGFAVCRRERLDLPR